MIHSHTEQGLLGISRVLFILFLGDKVLHNSLSPFFIMAKEYLPLEVKEKVQSRSDQLREQTDIVKQHLKEIDYNPVLKLANKALSLDQEIIVMLEDDAYDFDQRIALEKLLLDHNKELASFIAPKLKAVDVSGVVDHGITIILGAPPRPDRVPKANIEYTDVETTSGE